MYDIKTCNSSGKVKGMKMQLMKKAVLAWLLAAAVLGGCSPAGTSSGGSGDRANHTDTAADAASGGAGSESVTEAVTESALPEDLEAVSESVTESVSEAAAQASEPDTEEKSGKTGAADDDGNEDGTETEEPAVPRYPFMTDPLAAETEEPAELFLPGWLHLVKGIFEPVTELPMPEKSLTLLRQQLERKLGGYAGTWSAAVRELDTGEQIIVNDIAMPSASVLKLFIMGCTYHAIEQGQLERTSELVELLSSMIKASSNEAANKLFYLLGGEDYAKGIEAVNAYIQEQGYSDRTIAYNPFQNSSLTVHPGKVNQTCAADCAELLSRIYHRTFSRRKVCNEIEEWMLAQGTRYKIPKAIPDSALVGNKTGETDSIENDVAIIYTPLGDYILCVFSTDWPDKKQAEARITEVSAEVYAYFTDPDYVASRYPPIDCIGNYR